MDSKSDREKKFICPYCRRLRDISEINYKTEMGGFRPYLGKLNRPVSHNTYVWEYEKREVPICDDCLIILQEANEKAIWIAVGIFILSVICILYYILKNDSDSGSFIILTGLAAVVCYIIKWFLKDILSSKQGIKNGPHYPVTTDPLFDFSFEEKRKEMEKKEEEKYQEFWKKIDEDNKNLKIVKVDMGCGKVGYIGVRSPKENNHNEENEESEEYKKIKKFEEGANIDYSDEDFEGHFV